MMDSFKHPLHNFGKTNTTGSNKTNNGDNQVDKTDTDQTITDGQSIGKAQGFKYQVFSENVDSINVLNTTDTESDNSLNRIVKTLQRLPANLFDGVQKQIPARYIYHFHNHCTPIQMMVNFSCLILILLLFTFTIIHWKRAQYEIAKNENLCLTKQCLITSSNIITHRDLNRSICENFFQFACGAYYEPFHPDQPTDSPTGQMHQALVTLFGGSSIRDYFKRGRSRRLMRFERPMLEHLNEVNTHALITAMRDIYETTHSGMSSAKYKVAQFFDSCISHETRNWHGAQPLMTKLAPILGGIWLFDHTASNETGAGGNENDTVHWPENVFSDYTLASNIPMQADWKWVNAVNELQINFHVPIFIDFMISSSTSTSTPKIMILPDYTAWSGMYQYKIEYIRGMMEILVKDAGIPYGDQEMKRRMEIFMEDIKYIGDELNKLLRSSVSSNVPQKFKLGELDVGEMHMNMANILTEYFTESGVTFDSNSYVYSKRLNYLKKIPEFLLRLKNNYSEAIFNRQLNNYMLYNVISSYAWHLSYDYYMHYNNFHSSENHILELDCFFVTHELFDTVLGAIYVSKHLHEKTEKEVTRMVEYLKDSLRNHLNSLSWMDEETKEKVRKRVDDMKILYKIPEIMRDEQKLNYAYRTLKTSYNYLENVFEAIQYIRGIYNRLMAGVTETSEENWSSRDVMVYDTHVAIHLQLDEVFIPPGMLQLPIYHHNLPAAVNFGGLGSLVGTALGVMVGENSYAVRKDKKIELVWTDVTKTKYKERRQCVYYQMMNATRAYFNVSDYFIRLFSSEFRRIATATINEASGMDIANDAFDKWIQNPQYKKDLQDLPGVSMSPKQLFYLSYAQSYCHNMDFWDELYKMASYDSRPPHEIMVNNILNELTDFGTTFNCPVGTPMNPEKKCRAII